MAALSSIGVLAAISTCDQDRSLSRFTALPSAIIARQVSPDGRLNVAACGAQSAQSAHYGDAATLAAIGTTIPAGRLAVPADIAQACLFLAGSQAAYITGALQVHGGGERTAWSRGVGPR
jgi:NAD(P)-dependent dehydrogenase (short-subunit alcohol dehydrogenase family)